MEGPTGFGKRVATAASIMMTAFLALPNASAQLESSPEEIIVRGFSYGEIREQIRLREQAVFTRFNEINSDDRFDIHCTMDSRAESRTLERRCLSNSWREQERNYARAFSGRVTLTPGNTPAEFRAQQLQMQAKLKEEMRRLSYEDPALGEAVSQLGQAMQALELRRGGQPTSTAFRTVAPDSEESLFGAERIFEVQIGLSAWTHYLRYPTFTLSDVSGTVRKIEVDCEEGRRVVDYEANVEWGIPQDWSRCLLLVRAKRGSKFMFYEFE